MYFFASDENLFQGPTEDSMSFWPGMWHTTTHALKRTPEGRVEVGGGRGMALGRQCGRHAQMGGSRAPG